MQSSLKTITKNTALLLFGNIINKLFAFFIVIILARRLGDVGFGKFSFALSFSQIFIVFADLGLGFLVIREVARDRALSGKFAGHAIAIRFLSSLFVFFLSVVAIKLSVSDAQTRFLVYSFGLYFIFISLHGLFGSVFMGYEKMEFNVGINLLEKSLILFFCLIALSGKPSLYSVGPIYATGGFIAFLVSFFVIRFKFLIKPSSGNDLKYYFSFLKKSYPIAIGNILAVLYFYSNMVILSKFFDSQVVGWYSSAFYLSFYVQFIPGAFLGSIFPVMSRFFKDSSLKLLKLSQKSLELIIAFALPVSIVGFILAEKVILYFYGQPYLNAIPIFKILILGTVFYCSISFFGHFLVSIDQQELAAKISAIALALNLLIILVFLPVSGYITAAFAILLSSFGAFVVSCVAIARLGFYFSWLEILKRIFFALSVMTAILLLFKGINIFILTFLSFCVYFAALYLLGFFSLKRFDKNHA